ncbi:MAG TPA: YIP1 family protein [Vicinamibacterales bacterium]|nr:YIP1 family protein [Vicinamibacterales bacterium]
MASFQNRVIGALTLQASTYEEVENDASATSQAAIIVVAAAVLGSLGSLLYGFGMGIILGPIFALIGWVIGSFVVMFVGTKLLPGKNTSADLGQMLRVVGFAQSPALFNLFSIIPILGFLVLFVTWIWGLVTMVIGVKAALDYDDTMKAVIVCLIAWAIMFVCALIAAIVGGGAAMMTGAMLNR